jgi:hypothetical protein
VGQYYKIVSLTDKQYLHPHVFGEGIKLLEFGASGRGAMMGLAILLADGNNRGGGDLYSDNPIIGSWAGSKVVVAGDYADEGKWLTRDQIREWRKKCPEEYERAKKYDKDSPNLYSYAEAMFEDISEKVIWALCDDHYIFDDFARAFGDGASWSSMSNSIKGKKLRRKLRDRARKLGASETILPNQLRPDMALSAKEGT